MFTGLKSVIFPSTDLGRDTAFWKQVSGVTPYFEQPYYVGFSINGFELGLDPNAHKAGLRYPVSYWHVSSAPECFAQLKAAGVVVNSELQDVGAGLMMATFKDPTGNIFGIIEDPKA